MFISSTEKINIQNAIESLRFSLADATTEILYLKAKIKALEGKAPETKKPRKKHTMSPEVRAKMSQIMKEFAIFLIFLFFLYVVAFSNLSSSSFRYNQLFLHTFLHKQKGENIGLNDVKLISIF